MILTIATIVKLLRKSYMFIILCAVVYILYFICIEQNNILASKDLDNNKNALIDNKSLYVSDNQMELNHIYITVVASKDAKSNRNHVFSDLVNYRFDYNDLTTKSPKVDIILQEGNQYGPMGMSIKKTNAVMKIRGHGSSCTKIASQKSYYIEFLKSNEKWQGQNTIILNKHPHDLSRVRNKLSFDYLKLIPDTVSFGTRFVSLHLKDTTGVNNGDFEDFGLYASIEKPCKSYLKAHLLDPKGSLYKADKFQFLRYPDNLKLNTDIFYDEDRFKEVLSIKANANHSKLIAMINAVNDPLCNINNVINKYFDRNNYITWMATNILFGNRCNNSENFLLYSPSTSNKWYFISWDLDGTWGEQCDELWRQGIWNYWSVPLHKKFLKEPGNLQQLTTKIEELSKIICKEKTIELLNNYRKTIDKLVLDNPEEKSKNNKKRNYKLFNKAYDALPNNTVQSIAEYYRSLEKPMPFFLLEQQKKDGGYMFFWENSYDFYDDNLTYNFYISSSPDFTDLNYKCNGIKDTQHFLQNIAPGTYYWKIEAQNSKGNTQVSYDTYTDMQAKNKYRGIRKIILK